MGDKPKVKIRSTGFGDLSIELPNGTDLVKYLNIMTAHLDFGIERTHLNLKCFFVNDELDLDVAQADLDGVKFEVTHTYPRSQEITELLKELETENKELRDKLKAKD